MEISGHLAKTRSASGTGTTLLVDSCPPESHSLSSCTAARMLDVIQASFLPGPHRLPLSSLMHGAAAKMNWLQESHNVRVNCHHLSCGLAGSFHRHTISCTGGNGAILLRDEARYLDDVMSRLNCGYSRPRVHRLLSATSVQIASPAFCNCRP